MTETRHFLNLSDAGPDGIAAMLADALDRKAARAGWPKGRADADAPLAGHVLAMVFEKNSTRTRFSFDAAIRQLGGSGVEVPVIGFGGAPLGNLFQEFSDEQARANAASERLTIPATMLAIVFIAILLGPSLMTLMSNT